MLTMRQEAPYPDELKDLVNRATLWPGWQVSLVDMIRDPKTTHGGEAKGLTLIIKTLGPNTYHPERGQNYSVSHLFIVPAATYNRASWQRWLFERYVDVFRHEAMESFQIDEEHPYAATHGPGDDPYVFHEYASSDQRRMSFKGMVNPS